MSIELVEKPLPNITTTDVLPSSWELSKISDVCLVNPSYSFHLKDDVPITFLPMPAVEELTGKIDTSISRPYGEIKKGYTKFQEGDVLFAKITPCMENGKVAVARGLLNGVGCGSTEFHVLKPYQGINEDYVRYYVLQNKFRNVAQSNMSGTAGQKRVPADFMKNAEIPIPPSNEQIRIVSKIEELFSQLDDGEAALKRTQKLVEQYRQSVLKAAVTGELTKDWREKHKGEIETGDTLLQRILIARREAWKQSELGKMQAKGTGQKDDNWKTKYPEPKAPNTTNLPELPEGWVWSSLDQLLDTIEAGKNFKCEERPPRDGEVGVVKVSAVTWGIFNEQETKTITDKDRINLNYQINKGDFLFSRANTIELVGACLIVSNVHKCLLLSDKILRFKFVESNIKQWIDLCLKSRLGRDQIESLATGNQDSMRNISQEKIRKINIPLPSLLEISEISSRYEAELSKIHCLRTQCEFETKRVKSLKQAILKQAFSGQLVPQDSTDEPASELLKRIAIEREAISQNGAKPKTKRAKK